MDTILFVNWLTVNPCLMLGYIHTNTNIIQTNDSPAAEDPASC